MNKNKTLQIFTVLACSLLLITGCKDSGTEADPDSNSDNNFLYDGKTYSLESGIIYDYGEGTTGFRNYDFLLTEKQENFEDESEEADINSDYYIYFWLESLGASSFTGGTFNFDDSDEADASHLYDGALIFIIDASEEDFEEYFVTAGSVDVSISGDTYTLDFDVTLNNNKTLVGKFSYDFEIIDETQPLKSATLDTKKLFINR